MKRTSQALVVVVDDDVDLCANVAAILEQEGYDVRQAHDGAAALAILREAKQPCLLLLDLSMPHMSGFQLLDVVARDRHLPELNVVVMSGGMTRSGLMNHAPILQKPFDADRLVATVARYALPRGSRGDG